MKINYHILVFCVSSLIVISASHSSDGNAAEKKNNKPEKTLAASAHADWSQYSWGVYYKNLVYRERDTAAKEAHIKKALQHFKEAEASGRSLDRLYMQMAECYWMRSDYVSSLEYAKKSLALDNTKVRPYNKIFNIYVKMRNYRAAAQILEQCLSVLPDTVHMQFLLAEHYYKNMNDLNRAAGAFMKVIVLSERFPVEDHYKERSYLSLAAMAYRKGEIERAISLYREVLNINKENVEAIYYLALAYMETYDLSEAEIYSRMFLNKNPDNRIVNSVLGRIYYIRDDIRALSFLNSAKNAQSISGMLALGLYSELIRDDRTAEKHLDVVKRLAPKTITIYMALARINVRKKDASAAFNDYVAAGILMYNSRLYEEARHSFNEALGINAAVPGIYYYLGKVNEDTRHYSLALYYYKEANRIHPDTDLMLNIGYIYGVKKEYENAIGYFNRATERDPNNPRPYFFKGLVSIWQEDYPAAEKLIKRAISLDEKSETYYFYLAVVMDRMSKLDLAVASLEKAIMHNPKSARSYNYLGYLYADNNMKIDESLSLVQKALEIEPGNGAYTDSLGWVYYRKGNYKLALDKLLSAEEILRKTNNPDSVVYDHIGDAYLKLGSVDNALKYWNMSNEIKKSPSIAGKIKKYQNNQTK